MSMTESYISILDGSLDKKIGILDKIISLNARQTELLDSEKPDADAFNGIVEEKAVCIDELNELDKGFQLLYDNVKAELENNKARYAGEIAQLQRKITIIMEKSTSIQAEEHRNSERVKRMFSSLHREARTAKKSRQQVANYYRSMNKLSSEPVFMDKKK